MAIIRLGIRSSEKTAGESPAGQRIYLVGSDTKITDLDDILNATYGGDSIPDYNDPWAVGETILVVSKRAVAHDRTDDGVDEGFWYLVYVDYSVPADVQNELDPADRDWEWSKGNDKRQMVAASSLFDTSGYFYPDALADEMVNLDKGDAFLNTIGEPPEGGVPRVISRGTIVLTKYVTDVTDLGTLTSWAELDTYIDKVNELPVQILDVSYDEYTLLVDAIDYASITENGFERIKVTFRIIVDTLFTHIYTFQSASYNYAYQDPDTSEWSRRKILDEDGNETSTPQLIDKNGQEIPLPSSPPFVKRPVYISGGANELADLTVLGLPTTIP